MAEILRMKGTVEHIVYSNPENGYHVIELQAEQDLVTVVGDLGEVNEGEEVVVTGRFVTHPTFGFQFQAESHRTNARNKPWYFAVSVLWGAAAYRSRHSKKDRCAFR